MKQEVITMRNGVATLPEEIKPKPARVQHESECCHYWLIDSPDGAISKGVCKFCGEEKDFYNSIPEFTLYKRDQKNSKATEPSD